ncbi:MAG: hypothetical protein GY786_23915 [Proteobacteria bacterium]|nr:hypothetical protein [Pseudomonadota bacterium]
MVVGFGVITADEVSHHFDSLSADTNHKPPMSKLVDYRLIDNIETLPGGADRIAEGVACAWFNISIDIG